MQPDLHLEDGTVYYSLSCSDFGTKYESSMRLCGW